MDRNTVIATILIGIIMMVWLYWMAPQPVPESERPEPGLVDTLAQQPAPPVMESAPDLRRPATPQLTDSVFAGALTGEEQEVVVSTDLYTAVFSSHGATLRSFTLNEYERSDHTSAVQIADTSKPGSIGMVFTSPASHSVDTRQLYFAADTRRDTLRVVDTAQQLTFEVQVGGGVLRKIYTFKPETYEVGLRIEQENASSFSTGEGYDLVWYGGIPFSEDDPQQEGQRAGAHARSGGEVEDVELSSDAFEEMTLRGQVDWVAVKSQFFTAVVIPSGETEGAEMFGERTAEPGEPLFWEDYEVSLRMPPSAEDEFRLFLGPMEYYRMSRYDLGLYGMVDYGYDIFEWMTRPLAKFVFIPTFRYLGSVLPNYGIVIIVLALLMKIVLYPLTKASYRSMAKMRDLQPEMELIKEKHADNPQKQQEAMMKLYKETGVNPLGGCLPMLLQYPVIIALWQFLPQSIEIRQQGFLWAQDLSAPDKILSLPFEIPLYGDFVAGFTLLMGLSMIVQMKIQMASTPSNPQTKIFTYVMPVMIFAIFNRFASGLSLYYLCYNVFTAAQQQWINKSIEREKEAASNGQGTKRDVRAAKKGKVSGRSTGKSGKKQRAKK